jgi:regulation of enolase protein 1 (concanavalin A-like superfamily)
MKNNSSILLLFVAIGLLFVSGKLSGQNSNLRVKEIPYPLQIVNNPVSFTVNDTLIRITAEGKTNLFNNPNGIYRVQNAPMVLFEPKNDFTLTAKVTGELKSIYDVAALVVWQNGDTWGKLCYENSVDKVPTIVSVVTRKYSDDCNSIPTGSFAYLSIVKKGEEFSFYYSPDNINKKLIRHFRLELSDEPLKVGFAAHGSRGDGFTALFSEIEYKEELPENMRND